MKLKVTVNGTAYEIDVEVEEEERPTLGSIQIGGASTFAVPNAPSTASVPASSANAVVAPLTGSVFKILVDEGQEIPAGAVLVVLEAMKMETEITAPNAGRVAKILVNVGDPVQGGQALVELE